MKAIKIELSKGLKLVTFSINGMAMTTRRNITFEKETETHIIFKLPRKRKLFQMKKSEIVLMFIDHNLPIEADSDGNCFRGNACVNIVSKSNENIDEVRNYIESNNLIELGENDKAHLLWFSKEDASSSNYEENLSNCIYPDTVSSSSLIDNFRSR
jgi:hypothetical protein